MQLKPSEGGFDLLLAGHTPLAHRPDSPAISLACGDPQVAMVRGNFRLSDRSVAAAPLTRCNRVAEDAVELESADGSAKIRVECSGAARLSLTALTAHN
ncbi:MAG TPA: alpha-glucosidase, partial [Erythrobacter sp.]|nr:alpha-glucosidase [Erythrobacter sp.]